MQNRQLGKAVLILLVIVLIVVRLVYAKPFLVPLTFAAILSMLLLPIARWLESKKIGRAIATLLSILVLIGIFAGLIWFISWQISDLASDAGKIEQQVSSKAQQLRMYVSTQLGIPPEKQQQILKQQQQSAPGQMSAMITGFLSGLGTLLTNTLLVLVYIFLLIYFRTHLKQFVIKLVRKEEQPNTVKIINNTQKVVQKYLTGLALMIISLWIMYGIGFSIAGVKNAIFFAILCGVLEIIPFVGNLVGTLTTMGVSLVQGGNINIIIGIAITYGLVQFIQSYIIEPLVVGAEVNINPLFTIVGIVAGEMVWGIPGMILAIPLLGIAKIISDNVEPLKPFGFLIGKNKGKDNKGFGEKIKGWFK